MFNALKMLWTDEEGLTTVEYALLLVLIVVVVAVGFTTLGTTVDSSVDNVVGELGG